MRSTTMPAISASASSTAVAPAPNAACSQGSELVIKAQAGALAAVEPALTHVAQLVTQRPGALEGVPAGHGERLHAGQQQVGRTAVGDFVAPARRQPEGAALAVVVVADRYPRLAGLVEVR